MVTFEELRSALADVCSSHEAYGIDEHIDKAVELVDNALVELAALRAWQERAMPLLRAMIHDGSVFLSFDDDDFWLCPFCHRECHYGRDDIRHTADCPVIIARALLTQNSS